MAANARLLTTFIDTPEDEELEDLFLLEPELAAIIKEEQQPVPVGMARGPSSVTKFLRKRLQERQDLLSRQNEEEDGDLFVTLIDALSDEEGEHVVNERDDYAVSGPSVAFNRVYPLEFDNLACFVGGGTEATGSAST